MKIETQDLGHEGGTKNDQERRDSCERQITVKHKGGRGGSNAKKKVSIRKPPAAGKKSKCEVKSRGGWGRANNAGRRKKKRL